MVAASKAASSSALQIDSSNSIIEHELVKEEDDWVIVKTQKITILIPPPSPVRTPTSPARTTKQRKARKNIKRRPHSLKWYRRKDSNTECEKSAAIPDCETQKEDEHNTSVAISSENGAETYKAMGVTVHESHDIPTSPHLCPSRDALCAPASKTRLLPKASIANGLDNGNNVVQGKARMSKPCKRAGGAPRTGIGALNVVNLRLQASNIDRKLKMFGGLRRWLMSQGLDRFVEVFKRKELGKYQLVRLTMSKLKGMGIDAVGPRRKLIHAIDCLSQPYFKVSN